MNTIAHIISTIVKELFDYDLDSVVVSRPDVQFGDFASNVAMQLAKPLGRNPREIADQIATALLKHPSIKESSVAGPGFINMRLTDEALIDQLHTPPSAAWTNQQVVIETNNPNPFKDLHIGHAYNSIIADTIANLLEAGQAKVHRVSYHGDVGLHVGKSMWAIFHAIDKDPKKLDHITRGDRPSFMSRMYVEGSRAYETDPEAKEQIEELTRQSFTLEDPLYKQVYDTCKSWSFDYIAETIERLGSQPVERRLLESEADAAGVATVKKHIGDIFEESDGAVIFPGEKYGLSTRVFLSSRGTGLYASRDLGLMQLKDQEYKATKSVIVTAEEQRDYFRVVIKAAELCLPQLAGVTQNIATGTVKLSTGKMSSRTGEILNIDWLFEQLTQAIEARGGEAQSETIIGALRYAMLKVSIGSDVIFDIESSISLDGNSGPYLQYAHARARSILAQAEDIQELGTIEGGFSEGERALLVKVGEYNDVVERAVEELMPHQVCTYLYELAQQFNRFYEKNRIMNDEREAVRLSLVAIYVKTLKNGLSLLGIPAPQKM